MIGGVSLAWDSFGIVPRACPNFVARPPFAKNESAFDKKLEWRCMRYFVHVHVGVYIGIWVFW